MMSLQLPLETPTDPENLAEMQPSVLFLDHEVILTSGGRSSAGVKLQGPKSRGDGEGK
eukprot:CAMPEP_0184293584 /NCGR_PEP_ID=MMETSP1049-20130417/4967_1 /TAXON_ID=77928 /ORGANISM="Proteomonas sulcata, Strain CCMP704" /LENGTH=57 /DNA_ID=CAMNT_0026601589 /DNA_START=881 /DNA_END=1051 /DNA_ORIENTATION=+